MIYSPKPPSPSLEFLRDRHGEGCRDSTYSGLFLTPGFPESSDSSGFLGRVASPR
ncbi:Protein of unknown function [Pyronema omphalodes CBS 100304]|uniref:Uncharacterized protein n=1 Tax=Pyronema omphalodes (strain CBS 100304) TaxID=1076935 RepID=U4L330_PYROM|nr:Protein of unknown function [Pyronema omphalodes CBS 100304]